MKLVNILALILVILNSIGIIYIKYLDVVINKKIDEINYRMMENEHRRNKDLFA